MNKKKIIILVIVIILIIGGVIVLNIISNNKSEKVEEKNESENVRDTESFKLINNACDNLIDEEGNYNLDGSETEVICEKGFCHVTFQGENYGVYCNER